MMLLAWTLPLAGQVPADRPWFIAAFLGPGVGGPGDDMAAHLGQIGGFDASGCDFLGCFDYPSVDKPGLQWSVSAGRSISGSFGAKASVGGGDLGWVLAGGDSGTVSRHWSSTTLGVLLTVSVMPEIWFGAGPAVAWLRSGEGAPDEEEALGSTALATVTETSFGVQLEAGIQSSASKPLFLAATVSYTWLPPHEEGPYPKTTGSGDVPPFDASFGRLVVGLGLGVRFRPPH
jgi:hypothetical protein